MPTFSIDLEYSKISSRKFVKCCFHVDNFTIGDFDQLMLLGSYELAMNDLIKRLENAPNYDFRDTSDIFSVFEVLSTAFRTGEFKLDESLQQANFSAMNTDAFFALPLAIEAFDGEEAFIFMHNCNWVFVWKEWKNKVINHRKIDKNIYVEKLKLAMKNQSSSS